VRNGFRADGTVGSRPVVDDHLRSELLPKLLADRARDEIDRTARRKRDDDAHQPVAWYPLCERDSAGEPCYGGHDPNRTAFHRVPPWFTADESVTLPMA